jgi:hypothetical protein
VLHTGRVEFQAATLETPLYFELLATGRRLAATGTSPTSRTEELAGFLATVEAQTEFLPIGNLELARRIGNMATPESIGRMLAQIKLIAGRNVVIDTRSR